MGDQLCTARGAAGTEQGEGNTTEKRLAQGLLGIPRGAPAEVEEAVWEKGWEWGASQHREKLLAMLEAGIQALLGSRCEQRSNMSHPCSTGLSQRKAARSVPIPKTPGSKDTCKSWSRTEPSRGESVAAVMDKSRYPELQPWGRTLGQQELQEHLQVSPSDCWKCTLCSELLLILGLHGPGCSLIPLPRPQAYGTAPRLLYYLKLFKKLSYGAVSPFFPVDNDIIYRGVTGRVFIGG